MRYLQSLHASRHTLIVSTMTVATWRCKLIGRPSKSVHVRKSSKTIVEVLIRRGHQCGVRGGLFNSYSRLFSSVTIVDSMQDQWGACVTTYKNFVLCSFLPCRWQVKEMRLTLVLIVWLQQAFGVLWQWLPSADLQQPNDCTISLLSV